MTCTVITCPGLPCATPACPCICHHTVTTTMQDATAVLDHGLEVFQAAHNVSDEVLIGQLTAFIAMHNLAPQLTQLMTWLRAVTPARIESDDDEVVARTGLPTADWGTLPSGLNVTAKPRVFHLVSRTCLHCRWPEGSDPTCEYCR